MAILSFEQEFTKRHPTRISVLKFLRQAAGVDEVHWSDLTLSVLEEARDLMVKSLAANSAGVYCAVLRSFLTRAGEEIKLPTSNYAKVLKVRHEPSQNCCLTEDELIKFDEYEPKTQNERDAKILFMRAALSGARISDCKRMTESNKRGGFLSYVSQKTKTEVVQPVHRRLEKYLDMKPSHEMYGVTVNRIIKRICKKLGFNEPVTLFHNGVRQTKPKYEWISIHGGRRSFCTSLAARGVPIETIAKLAGHRNSKTTSSHYICIDPKNIGDAAMDFFNG